MPSGVWQYPPYTGIRAVPLGRFADVFLSVHLAARFVGHMQKRAMCAGRGCFLLNSCGTYPRGRKLIDGARDRCCWQFFSSFDEKSGEGRVHGWNAKG